jgi:hypothetical protein
MAEMLGSRFDHPWCEERPPAPADLPAGLIDTAELARRLGIARSTVYANARRYGAIRLTVETPRAVRLCDGTPELPEGWLCVGRDARADYSGRVIEGLPRFSETRGVITRAAWGQDRTGSTRSLLAPPIGPPSRRDRRAFWRPAAKQPSVASVIPSGKFSQLARPLTGKYLSHLSLDLPRSRMVRMSLDWPQEAPPVREGDRSGTVAWQGDRR